MSNYKFGCYMLNCNYCWICWWWSLYVYKLKMIFIWWPMLIDYVEDDRFMINCGYVEVVVSMCIFIFMLLIEVYLCACIGDGRVWDQWPCIGPGCSVLCVYVCVCACSWLRRMCSCLYMCKAQIRQPFAQRSTWSPSIIYYQHSLTVASSCY